MNNPSSQPKHPTLTTLLASTILTTALSITALAANQNYSITNTPTASAEFNFRVTLIPVPGKINAVSANLNFDPKNLSKTNGKVLVNLAKLDTGIGLRDEHARGYLGADKHPNAIFTLKSITGISKLETDKEVKGTAVGQFDLNGISQPLSAPIILKLEGKRINVSTTFDVTLADHKIEIPGANPKVDVKVNFTLEQKQ
jgi:polyisoprenoid-binding protein YceI